MNMPQLDNLPCMLCQAPHTSVMIHAVSVSVVKTEEVWFCKRCVQRYIVNVDLRERRMTFSPWAPSPILINLPSPFGG